MARKRHSTVNPWPPPPPPRTTIGEAFRKLWHPRQTHYENRCVTLAEVSLDLPLIYLDTLNAVPNARVRDATRLPGSTLRAWAVGVLHENVIAGMVLTDALALTYGRVGSVLGDGFNRFPDTQDTRELTMAAGEFWIEFQVPAGWEFVMNNNIHPAGHTGLVMVKRCHLSESFYQRNSGSGRLLGAPGCEGDVGFDIPCGYFPQYRFEGGQLVSTAPAAADGHFGIGCSIPYAFVRRAFYQPSFGTPPMSGAFDRPTHEDVLRVARGVADRLGGAGAKPRPDAQEH